MKVCVSVTAFFLVATLFAPAASQADVVTVSLIVDPNSVLSSNWTAGDLVEVTVQATSDGDPNQGFFGADFGSYHPSRGTFEITVDGNYLHIHDVKWGTTQVDTESWATIFDGMGGYVKADDTWVYDEFTEFVKPDSNDTRDIILTDTSMRAIPREAFSQKDLGRLEPVDYLHLVLEVQAGFAPGSSTSVTFYGQMAAYNVDQEDICSDLFGTTGGDVNTGSFTITNLPEPTSVALLLVGALSLSARRRLRHHKS